MSVKILCPYCGQRYEIENYEEGATINCSSCGQEIVLTLGLLDTEPDTPIEISDSAEEPIEESTSVSQVTEEITMGDDEPEEITNSEPIVANPKKNKMPILCAVLNSIGILAAMCLLSAIVAVIISGFGSDPCVPPLGLIGAQLLVSLSCFGLSQIVQCLFDIRENSVRQTELLERLVNGRRG